MKPEIRRFKDTDRDKVRGIATSTATGYPRSDLQLVADLLTEYYVTYEKQENKFGVYLQSWVDSPES